MCPLREGTEFGVRQQARELDMKKCCIYVLLCDLHSLKIAETTLVHGLFSQARWVKGRMKPQDKHQMILVGASTNPSTWNGMAQHRIPEWPGIDKN